MRSSRPSMMTSSNIISSIEKTMSQSYMTSTKKEVKSWDGKRIRERKTRLWNWTLKKSSTSCVWSLKRRFSTTRSNTMRMITTDRLNYKISSQKASNKRKRSHLTQVIWKEARKALVLTRANFSRRQIRPWFNSKVTPSTAPKSL